jgi:hypothetical protein
MSEWSGFDDGLTLGRRGAERGVIVADEVHRDGARITLERGGGVAPWTITCGVYGAMVHTRFFANEEESRAAFNAMKGPLGTLAKLDQFEQGFGRAVDAFVRDFP